MEERKTRAKKILELNYVLDEVFDKDKDSIIQLVIRGPARITSVEELIGMSKEDLLSFEYFATKESAPQSLNRSEVALIRAFKGYIWHLNAIGKGIKNDFMKVDPIEFDNFRISDKWTQMVDLGTNVSSMAAFSPSSPSAPATTNTNNKNKPSEVFKKGIKRDPTLFSVLKGNKDWDSWKRNLVATARAQDVEEVLQPNYTPVSAEDTELFDEKQKYMYSVFDKVLQSDRGKAFVRAHEADYNAQSIYIKLVDYYTKSVKASLDSSNLLSYITSTKIDSSAWKGTAEGFILHWQEQVRLYESLVDPSDHFSDAQKRTMLENALAPVKALKAVKDQANQFKTHTGNELSYEEYSTLVTSAAINHDTQFQVKSSKPSRKVYYHECTDFSDSDDDREYGIDSSISTILANVTKQSRNKDSAHFMPIEKWKQLTPEAKEIWDMLPNDMKSVILSKKTDSNQVKFKNPQDSKKPYSKKITKSMLHDILSTMSDDDDGKSDDNKNESSDEESESTLLVNTATCKNVSPADIRKLLSVPETKKSPNKNKNAKKLSTNKTKVSQEESNTDELVINGKVYRSVNKTVTYFLSKHDRTHTQSLVDRGANGGVAGEDVRVIHKALDRKICIRGIDNHEITDVPSVTAGGVTQTISGEVIAILNQYAYHGKGKTIHSSGQIEFFKNLVDDRSVKVGGKQHIKTNDGFTIPISIKSGLPYIPLRPFTDSEWDKLPHIILTSDVDWDPSVLDCSAEDCEEWFEAQDGTEDSLNSPLFDEFGNYRNKTNVGEHELYFFDADSYAEDNLDDIIIECMKHSKSGEILVEKKEPDYESLKPYFNWAPTNVIKKTFKLTTQYARTPASTILKKNFKSPFPAFNVKRRHEPVATDTIYSNTPAIDDGSTSAQIFVGTETLVTDIYGMKNDKEFVNTLEDNIRKRGAMDKLISDRAQVEISKRVHDILRALFIDDWQSEPHRQHQNPAERRIQTVKRRTNTLLDRTGAPAYTWLLAITYVCFVLNFTYNAVIDNVPMNLATGSTEDISPLLRFRYWQPVYYMNDDSDFPSDSTEERGRFVGISESVGHYMTFKILTDKSTKIIHRSNVRPADVPLDKNIRLDPLTVPCVVKSKRDTSDDDTASTEPSTIADDESLESLTPIPILDTSDLVGRTFLMPADDSGQRLRARIVKAIDDQEEQCMKNSSRIKFVCSMKDDQIEEIFSYNEILDFLEQQEEDTIEWKFKRITAHEGPLQPNHPNYNGSTYNVMIEWENGEITSEPLSIIGADDPVTCAIYARENKLLDKPGWKRFSRLAKREKKLLRLQNQAKLRSYRTSPRYKFGYELPRNNDYDHAIELDKRNGNTLWRDAIKLEIDQQNDYDTYEDLGLDGKIPEGHKRIKVHFVFDVKHDGRHKTRLVAGGHLTDIPLSSVYSGVVSLRGIRLVLFLAELNGLDSWSTDIGNAYLEATTKEKVYIVAGKEFGDLEGHILLIKKALYGLRSSGLRWHERLADCLRDMGFLPCKMEPDIWMKDCGDHYEYIAVYVDDLLIASKDPKSIAKSLEDVYKFKLKGTGPISYHLGCDFFRDKEGVLCFAPRKYIEKMINIFETTFGHKPSNKVHSPLEKGDHPELDTSEFLDQDGIQKYQSLLGALQWAVSLGRLDVNTAVMTMSSFRVEPRKGHMDRVKRIYSYLSKFRHATIRIRTEEPDLSGLPDQAFDWEESIYGEVTELLPEDAPRPLGKSVTTISYHDANLYHNVITGRSVTGVLHLLNKTPIDWYSKKQSTVETATYGSEYSSARTCVEQILDLRNTLRYLGVPIKTKSFMFGDNRSVVDSSMTPHAKIHKRHVALSFHRVREAIAAKIIGYYFINGEINPADILSKHWGHAQVWSILQPLLFWQGDTANLLKDD